MRPPVVYVYEKPGARDALVRGVGLSAWLTHNGLGGYWSAVRRGFLVRSDTVPDLLAAAAEDHVKVVQRAGDPR